MSAGLINFKDFLLVLIVGLGTFITVFLGSIIPVDTYIVHTLGYIISTTFFFFGHNYIFEQYCPLFGLLLFSITLFYNIGKDNFDTRYSYALNFIWIIASLYTQISFIGTLTIVYLFHNIGFVSYSFGVGYAIGCNENQDVINCLIVSIILNIFMRISQKSLEVFRNGIEFWGTLVGNISGLICSSEYFIFTYELNFYGVKSIFILFCILQMYIGLTANINSYTNIAGTFLFFTFLDIQYYVLYSVEIQSLTAISCIALVNLYILKELITHYPQYFILS
jgi:hypothetical protein